MKIEIEGGYFVTADKYQFVLWQRTINPDTMKDGEKKIGFFVQFANLVAFLIKKELRQSDADSFAKLEALIDLWGKRCEDAVVNDESLL